MSDGTDLTLTGLEDVEVTVVLAGVSCLQMQALAAGDLRKVTAAGNTLGKLAQENPEAVREAFLRNRDAFRIANMPEEVLDHLDLEVREGRLFERDDEGRWTEVEIQ